MSIGKRRDTSIAISQDRAEQLRRLAEVRQMSPRVLLERWIIDGLKSLGCDDKGVPYWCPPGMQVRKIIIDQLEFVSMKVEDLPMVLLRVAIDDGVEVVSEVEDVAGALQAAARVNRAWKYEGTKHGGRNLEVRRQGGAIVLTIDEVGTEDGDLREDAPRLIVTPAMAEELADAMRYLMRSESPLSEVWDLADPHQKEMFKKRGLHLVYDEVW